MRVYLTQNSFFIQCFEIKIGNFKVKSEKTFATLHSI